MAAAAADGQVRVEYRIVSFLDDRRRTTTPRGRSTPCYAALDTAGPDAFKTTRLYADQPAEGTAGPEDDELVAGAVAAGAHEDEVRPLIEDKAYEQWIANATDPMSRDGVNGTPTVFVDDQMQPDPGTAVDAVLQGHRVTGVS